MSSMKNRASSTLALTLAIAGALAAPMRSGASEFISSSRQHIDVAHAQPNAVSKAIFSEICWCGVRIVVRRGGKAA